MLATIAKVGSHIYMVSVIFAKNSRSGADVRKIDISCRKIAWRCGKTAIAQQFFRFCYHLCNKMRNVL